MPCCIGEIQIGKFKEEFEIPLKNLTIEDYRKQWQAGLERIQSRNESCLVTELENSKKYPRVIMWVLYKEGDKVYIRNQFLFDKRFMQMQKKHPFTFENCYDFIPPRNPVEGISQEEKVSEWITDLDAIHDFLATKSDK